jgi:hypothetical protein
MLLRFYINNLINKILSYSVLLSRHVTGLVAREPQGLLQCKTDLCHASVALSGQ